MKKPKCKDEEYTFEDGVIISETDLKGIITFANRNFCKIAGYDKEELLGKSHNVIRHPDMPKATFKDLWDTIKQDKEWVGYIKNLRKDGRYYWVKTFIKPVFKDGKKVGYIAARKPVTQKDKEEMEAKYKEMREKE